MPAVDQQRHRLEHQPTADFQHHHGSRQPDHDAGAVLALPIILREVVGGAATG